MGRLWKLIAAGVVAFALSLLVFLPAGLLARWLPPGITTGVLTGTVWNGASDSVSVHGRPLGALRWKLRPIQLLRGRLAVYARITRPPAGASGVIMLGAGDLVRMESVDVRWPLADLPSRVAPSNWSGNVQLALRELELSGGVIRRVIGTVEARDLVAAPNGVEVGSYRVTFDPQSNSDEAIVGKLEDLGGPMEVTGTLTLKPDRNTVVRGLVRARPEAPATITRELQNLRIYGEPDAQGRLPFVFENAY